MRAQETKLPPPLTPSFSWVRSSREGICCGQDWSGPNQSAPHKGLFPPSSWSSPVSSNFCSLFYYYLFYFTFLHLIFSENKLEHTVKRAEDLAEGCVNFNVKHVTVSAALKSVFLLTPGVPMASVGESLLQREEVFSRSSWPKEVNLYHKFKLVWICCNWLHDRLFAGLKTVTSYQLLKMMWMTCMAAEFRSAVI